MAQRFMVAEKEALVVKANNFLCYYVIWKNYKIIKIFNTNFNLSHKLYVLIPQ